MHRNFEEGGFISQLIIWKVFRRYLNLQTYAFISRHNFLHETTRRPLRAKLYTSKAMILVKNVQR